MEFVKVRRRFVTPTDRRLFEAGVCAVTCKPPRPEGAANHRAHHRLQNHKNQAPPKAWLSPRPWKQRRRSASCLRSRAIKLHGIKRVFCYRHEDL
jgi:hypothetical protein